MKNILLVLAVAAGIGMSGCGDSNTSSPSNTNVASTPQACGTSIPGQYCTEYNPSAYSYNNLTYGSYGYGSYGAGGFAGYGCPVGYQPLSLGNYYGNGQTSYTCVMNNYFSGYSSGYSPYYAGGQRWANHTGHGPAQACSVGPSGCSTGRCLAFSGSNMGYCAR